MAMIERGGMKISHLPKDIQYKLLHNPRLMDADEIEYLARMSAINNLAKELGVSIPQLAKDIDVKTYDGLGPIIDIDKATGFFYNKKLKTKVTDENGHIDPEKLAKAFASSAK